MDSGKVFLAALAGLAAGATLGILFAPGKGSETRKKISKNGGKYVDDLNDRLGAFSDKIMKQFESLKTEATQVVENGKSKAESTIEKGKERLA